jgi:hypothetical protein
MADVGQHRPWVQHMIAGEGARRKASDVSNKAREQLIADYARARLRGDRTNAKRIWRKLFEATSKALQQ